MVLLKNGLDSKQKTQMLDKIDKVDGVKWSLGMNSLIGPTFPESMIPSNIKEMLQSGNYEVQFVCSEYYQQQMNVTHSLTRFRRSSNPTVRNLCHR